MISICRYLTVVAALLVLLAGCAGQQTRTIAVVDTDGDGVIDGLDRCPDSAPGARVDSTGCADDEDRDGVFDRLDRCPGTLLGVAVDLSGCPADADGDGIIDSRDRCPDTPAGLAVLDDGCPRQETTGNENAKERETLARLELDLHFSTGTCRLLPGNELEIAKGRRFLRQHPGARVVIEGHTDSVGPAKFNLTLSRQRAERVARLLAQELGRSLNGFRIVGYGESRPIADNNTQAGRERNRRVVLRIVAGD